MGDQSIYVSISLGEEIHSVGTCWFHQRGSRQSSSFEYEKEWLKNKERFSLEPALSLSSGSFHTKAEQTLFGALSDSSPDRWGRVLMRRAESLRAQSSGRAIRTLSEADYLLGVNDEVRQGALRFSVDKKGPYLSEDKNKIPPLVELPELLTVTQRYLEDKSSYDDFKILLAPGSSLGGARPKASVRDSNGQLAIAKFPKNNDDYNVVLWEAVALTLAQKAGVNTSQWRIETVLNKPVLLLSRFDRKGRARVPFLSSMSMLGAKDNEVRSYLEIAYALIQTGLNPKNDLEELWRRIIFTVLISNTDDHLRNHGFLYHRFEGWHLSPAYDLNPTPLDLKARILSTSIDFDDPTASIKLAFSVINEFRIKRSRAIEILKEVVIATQQWRIVAQSLNINEKEIERMSSAFEHDELQFACSLIHE